MYSRLGSGGHNACLPGHLCLLSTISVLHQSQVSTYKVVTVNASRHGSDPCIPLPSSREQVVSRVNTIDEELHAPNEDFREELQTWMLLEVHHSMETSITVCPEAMLCMGQGRRIVYNLKQMQRSLSSVMYCTMC